MSAPVVRNEPAGSDIGVAAVETVALLPILVLLAMLVLQAAAAIWTTTATDLAVRQAARADSLGRDAGAAAEAALPSGMSVKNIDRFGPGHVRLQVDVVRVSPLPQFTVTREMELPEMELP